MARKDINSAKTFGNEERIQANFVELYAAIGEASASATNAASAAAAASAAVTAVDARVTSASAATFASLASADGRITSANVSIASVNTLVLAASAAITGHEAAWASYNATCTAASGAITTATTVGSQKTIGKTVIFRARCTITNKNTGAGNLLVDLPAASVAGDCPVVFMCLDTGTATALQLKGVIATSTSRIAVSMLTSATPITNNAVILIGGTYEKA